MERVVYDLDFNAEEELEGVFSLSLVETPAIESNFITLSSEKGEVTLSAIDDSKKILMGAALIPDKEILRKDGSYIRFSKEVVRRCMESFFKRDYQKNASIEHDMKESLQDVCVVESWVVDNPEMDKSKEYGLEVPAGTWMVAMKVEDEETYKLAKEGKIKGFSIEGMFPDRTLVKMSEEAFVEDISNLDDESLDTLAKVAEAVIEMADSKEEAIAFLKQILIKDE